MCPIWAVTLWREQICLNDVQSKSYLEEMGIKSFNFDHYFKGKSELGSLVETCVKFGKKLIFSTIGKNILNLRDFEIINR